MQWTLDRCRELYNAALDERKSVARRIVPIKFCGNIAILEPEKTIVHRQVSKLDQSRQLTEIKHELRPEYNEINDHVLRNVLERVDLAFKAFFRRVKAGEKSGYPRFQSYTRYDSFTYPDLQGWKVIPGEGRHAKLILSKIGTINVKLHRPIQGKIKTATIKREGEHWYVTFACEVESEALPVSYEDVGIDLGITHFAALSNGEMIDNPRHYRRAEKKLKQLQQALARKKRGSHRRKKAAQKVAKAHRKVRNQRKDFHHKESRKLVNKYQVIVFEELQAANLSKRPKPKQDESGKYLPNGAATKSGLNKSIRDAGWNSFTQMVKAKAECAGRTIIFVDPKNTSQICSACGVKGPHKDLEERIHTCTYCGVVLDRDHNAALNILALGHKQIA